MAIRILTPRGNVSFGNVTRHLKQDSPRILDEWWQTIKRESPSFAELEKLRNPVLYHEQNLDLIIKALEADDPAEQAGFLEQVSSMARDMASERLKQGFVLKDLLLSLAVFRSAVLDSVSRMMWRRFWLANPSTVLQTEKRINAAMDFQVAAVAEAYIAARDGVIRHREEMLRFHNFQLSKLNDLSKRMGESLDMARVLDSTARAICEMAEMTAAAVAVCDDDDSQPCVNENYGHNGCTPQIIAWLNSPLFQEVSGGILSNGRPLIIVNSAEDSRFAEAAAFGIHSLLAVPLRTADKVTGVLYGIDYIARDFTPHEINLILTFANQAALAIENARLYTRLTKAYVDLQELDAVKDDFVSIASHEIRTPLALIKGYASTLLRPELKLTPERHQRFLNGIDDASNRLISLIDNLLSVSRIESGRFRVNPQPTPVKDAVQHAVEGIKGQSNQHQIVLELPDDSIRARVNRDQFEQVIVNLVSNAIKYSPNGGKVEVSARKITSAAPPKAPSTDNDLLAANFGVAEEARPPNSPAEMAELRVSDEGMGIPEEPAKHIFEKFYRVETGLTRKTQGTGLGLYICKSIITSYGGEIWVESRPGAGSVFIFTLPLWKNDDN